MRQSITSDKITLELTVTVRNWHRKLVLRYNVCLNVQRTITKKPTLVQIRAGLMPNWSQAIIWTNDGLVYWCIYASLGHNVLTSGVIFTWHFRISFVFSYRKNLLNIVQSFSVLYFGISCSLRFWNFQTLLKRLVFKECISTSPKQLCSSCRRN